MISRVSARPKNLKAPAAEREAAEDSSR